MVNVRLETSYQVTKFYSELLSPIKKAIESIHIEKYGDGVRTIFFIIRIMTKEQDLYKDEVHHEFRKKSRLLLKSIKFLHENIASINTEQLISIIKQHYLDLIEYAENIDIEKFDFLEYKKDVFKSIESAMPPTAAPVVPSLPQPEQ